MKIDLISNGHTIDTDTLVVTPFFEEDGTHIDELSDEWFDELDDEDFGTIKNLINERDKIRNDIGEALKNYDWTKTFEENKQLGTI